MTSTECSMGLRSFIIQPNKNRSNINLRNHNNNNINNKNNNNDNKKNNIDDRNGYCTEQIKLMRSNYLLGVAQPSTTQMNGIFTELNNNELTPTTKENNCTNKLFVYNNKNSKIMNESFDKRRFECESTIMEMTDFSTKSLLATTTTTTTATNETTEEMPIKVNNYSNNVCGAIDLNKKYCTNVHNNEFSPTTTATTSTEIIATTPSKGTVLQSNIAPPKCLTDQNVKKTKFEPNDDLNIDNGCLRNRAHGNQFLKKINYRGCLSKMKATSSAIQNNKCFAKADNNSAMYQNGFIESGELSEDFNQLNHNHYNHNHNHINNTTMHQHLQNHQQQPNNYQYCQRSSTPSSKASPSKTKSTFQLPNGNIKDHEVELCDESLIISTPTKEKEEYYSTIIKTSSTQQHQQQIRDDGWKETDFTNGSESRISSLCPQHSQQSHFSQQQLHYPQQQQLHQQQPSNAQRDHNCHRLKSNLKGETPPIRPPSDDNPRFTNNCLLTFERDELRRRIVAADRRDNGESNDRDSSESDCGDNVGDAAIDAEVSEALFRTFNMSKNIRSNMPTKFHVLSYIANTNTPLHIRRTGTELQVTDITGFPLMDVWLKSNCFRPTTWVLEAYGAAVLLLTTDNSQKSNNNSFWRRRRNPNILTAKQQQSSQQQQQQQQQQQKQQQLPVNYPIFNGSSPATSSSVLQVQDSEGQTLGYFVVGDPFIIQNRERKPIARIVASHINDECSKTSLSSTCIPSGGSTYSHLLRIYQCILENNKQEIGRLEVNNMHLSLMQLRFGNQLDGADSVKSSNAMTFSLKLLLIASAIRLAAAISSPTNGEKKKISKKNANGICKTNNTVLAGTANPSESCCTIV